MRKVIIACATCALNVSQLSLIVSPDYILINYNISRKEKVTCFIYEMNRRSIVHIFLAF